MPKLKTHKGLAKRIKITGTGKVKTAKRGRRHRNSHMSGDTMRSLNQKRVAPKAELKKLQKMLHMRLNAG